MAVNVMIGRTNKRINSTSQTFADSTSLDCRLKEPCSQQAPVFIVQGLSKTTFYNYAKFLNHYYWIDDIVYETNDIQEVHCHLDPLATYKGAIENSYAFIQYGDSGNWNKYIDDLRFSPESRAPEANFDDDFDCIPTLASNPSNGYVILRYFDCGGNTPGVKVIAMTLSAFSSMLNNLANLFDATSTIGEITAAIGGQGSWRDNIISCVYVPLTGIDTSQHVSQIRLGGVPCNVSGYMQAAITLRPIDYTITINHNPSYWTNCPFMRNPRWVSVQVSTPFGCASIPYDLVKPILDTDVKLYVKSVADIQTGDVTIKITDKNDGLGVCLASFSGNISVNFMNLLGSGMDLGKGIVNSVQSGINIASTAFSLGASMGGTAVAAQNAVPTPTKRQLEREVFQNAYNAELNRAGNQGTQAALVASGIDIAQSLPTGIGTAGMPSGGIGSGFSSLYLTTDPGKGTFAMRLYKPLSNPDYQDFCDLYGYPVNDYMRISSIAEGSFIKCSGASVQGALGATEANKSTINSYLNAGFYLEA